MESNEFDKLHNNLSLELSKYLLKIKAWLSLNSNLKDLSRESCRKWITKLSSIRDLNLSTINNHITYARIMLDMLLKNNLEQPFLEDPPETDILPPAEEYIFSADLEADFSDELDKYFALVQSNSSKQNLESLQQVENSKPKKESSLNLDHLNSIFTAKQYELEKMLTESESPSKLKKNKIENRIIMMREKFKGEILTRTKIHESKIREILMRKNLEVNDQREKYERKLLEVESEKNLLEKKYQLEMKTFLESKERELSEMKEHHEMEIKSKETALVDLLSKHHKEESYQLEKKHTNEMEDFTKETKVKIKNLIDCHKNKMQETVNQVKNLERKLKGTMADLETVEREKRECQDLNVSLKNDLERIQFEADSYKNSLLEKEAEMKRMESDHRLEVKTLRYQSESVEESLKLQQASSNTKLSERISYLQKLLESKENHLRLMEQEKGSSQKLLKKVGELEGLLVAKEDEIRVLLEERSFQLKEVIGKHSADVEQKENIHKKELEEINFINEEKLKHSESIKKALKDELRKKDEALANIRKNLEANHEKTKRQERELRKERDDLQFKITNLEKGLSNIRMSRMKLEQSQTNKFKKLQDEFQDKMSLEMRNFDSEKKELHSIIEKMKENFKKEKQHLLESQENALLDMKLKFDHKTDNDLKIRELLESKLQMVEQEKEESIGLLRRELNELGEKQYEEMKNLKVHHQIEINNLRKKSCSDLEQIKLKHYNKIKRISESQSLKMKKLRLRFESRLFEADKILKQINDNLQLSEQKNIKQATDFNEKLNSITKKLKEETSALSEIHEKNCSKIEGLRRQLLEKEEALKECQAKCKEQVSLMRSEHLERLKTMVPSSIKDDLEEAIRALRSQTASLKERLQLMEGCNSKPSHLL